MTADLWGSAATDAAVTADAARRAAEATASPIELPDHPEGLVVRRVRRDEEVTWEDFEPKLASPREARGDAELHTARSFAAYVNRLADTRTTVWADAFARQGQGRVDAVFNDHTRARVPADQGKDKIGESLPGWRDHRAVFLPQHDPEWLEWVRNDGKHLSKKEFGRFLTDHAHVVRETDVSKLVDAAIALSVSRVKSTQEDIDLESGQVKITYTEEVRQQKQARQETLPPRLVLGLHVYQGADEGEEPFRVEAVLQWDSDDNGKAWIGYQLQQIPVIRQQAWNREIGRLLGLLDPHVTTLAGAAPAPLR